jgi:uncharacterized membrane protein YcgQ (UPF0703/DUF1980 family)
MKARVAVPLILGIQVASSPLSGINSSQDKARIVADVSVVQLIANPDQFDGRSIRVIGFCWFEFERNALYLHREDFEQGIAKNAVWLSMRAPVSSEYTNLRNKYVIVEGTFSASEHGHFGMFSGSIKSITRLEEWNRQGEVIPPRKPESP